MRALRIVLLAALIGAGSACDRIFPRDPDAVELPAVDAVQPIFAGSGLRGTASFEGRILEFRATQDREQLRRGGTLWARVGPYIYLFSPGTRAVMDSFPQIAAVRAITLTPDGQEIARATLQRGKLNDVLWRRSLNIHGRAVTEGTESPRLLEELVSWGHEHTTYQYNPEFVPD